MLSAQGQDDRRAVTERNFSEELYIQTDRDIYIAGEEGYIRIFKLDRLTHNAGGISSVAYVDLIDNYNNPVVQLKIGTEGTSGAGVFIIPDTLRTGNYLLRAYTNWIKNFSPEAFAYKNIAIINPFGNITRMKVPSPDQRPYNVLFYPETGSLVSGVSTKVGVECFNENGDPVAVKGMIVSSGNDTLAFLGTDKKGKGLVSLKPVSTAKLYFEISGPDSAAMRFALPDVTDDGIAFNTVTDREKGLINIRIHKGKSFSPGNGRVKLVYYPVPFKPFTKEIFLGSDTNVVLRQENLPAGLARIALTDGNDRQLASRWIINENSGSIIYDVKGLSDIYAERTKVSVEIESRDREGKNIESDLTVSVIKSVLSEKNSYTDLSRYIQAPGVRALSTDLPFSDVNDCLIFYHGAEGMSTKLEEDTGSTIKNFPELEGHLISGVMKDRVTGEPLKNVNITLSFIGKTARCRFTTTDENGKFNFASDEYGIKEIVIQPLVPTLTGCYVDLIDPFLPAEGIMHTTPFYIDSTRIGEINKAVISMQVRGIYEPFVPKSTLSSKVNGRPDFYGEPDRTIVLSDYIELTTLKEVFKEIVPGVSTYREGDKSNFRLVNKYPNGLFSSTPLVLLDGVPVYNLDKVLTIKSTEIEKVEVLNTRYFISDIIIEGIINIVSKKGDMSVLDFDKSVFRQEFRGLQDGNTFISPDYSTEAMKKNRIPDFRNTLYWNPGVKTGKNGKTVVEFYTSDEPGEYTVILEGFASDGSVGRNTMSFTVQKSQNQVIQ